MGPGTISPVAAARRDPHIFGGPNASIERGGARTVAWLRGEHDLSTVAELSGVMGAAIALDDSDLVIDMSDVEFVDAAIVGVIVRARVLLRSRSRSLTVRAPSRCARRIFELCGLSHLLEGPPDPTPSADPWRP